MISTSAFAADMPQPLPPPQIAYQPIVMEQPTGAWYLRGDIGIGIISQRSSLFQQNPRQQPATSPFDTHRWPTPSFFGVGVGYEFNNWLRFDVTAEYRTRAAVNAFGIYTFGGGAFGDQYKAFLKSDVFLANAYIDLGTWNCLTPFIGFGIGGAYNHIRRSNRYRHRHIGNGIGRNSQSIGILPGRCTPASPTT